MLSKLVLTFLLKVISHVESTNEISHPVTRARIKVKKKYLGLTQDSFKSRYSGHKTSFKHPKYKNATRLSTAIWNLKEANPPIPFQLKFSILKLARAYTRESKRCALCSVEKTEIAFSDPSSTLNLRSELMSKCRHRRKHLLFNWRWGIKQGFLKKIWIEKITLAEK